MKGPRSIGEVGSQLMARISAGDFPLWDENGDGDGAAVGTRPARSATELKGTATEAAAKSSDDALGEGKRTRRAYAVGTAEQRTEAVWATISASLHTMCRTKVTGCPTARPTRPVALVLVMGGKLEHHEMPHTMIMAHAKMTRAPALPSST